RRGCDVRGLRLVGESYGAGLEGGAAVGGVLEDVGILKLFRHACSGKARIVTFAIIGPGRTVVAEVDFGWSGRGGRFLRSSLVGGRLRRGNCLRACFTACRQGDLSGLESGPA